ncbi:complex I subunit 4 family protein [Polyangium aurulentum]|uniref:complex I subunit 4 family protein n=1 Tax=Polyangium aurulentum TaxID=2567896 RepID=UPI00146D9ACF|nr:NADH-quinone oxidoreductase subunit M [Polyangium aurulentum]UQA60947.1 NADH-quinone oxidoreductase subunit M [Polyangium aurulentum]
MSCAKILRTLLLAAAVLFVLSPEARAHEGAHEHGRIELQSATGTPIVELSPSPEGFTGAFVIRNVGVGPLDVSRVAVRTSPTDPRTPPGITVELEGGRPSMRIPPGEARRASITWRTLGARAREVYGQVLVESDAVSLRDDEPMRPAALGIHAERSQGLGPLGRHSLSVLLVLPLVGALLALLARLARRNDPRWLGASTVITHGANLALAAWLCTRFDRLFSRADGNDGLQFIERATLLPSVGVELFLGVDGLSIALLASASLVAFVAALASLSVRDRLPAHHGLFGLVVTGALGVLVSHDLFLLQAFWLLAGVSASLLAGLRGGEARRRASIKLLVASLASSALLLAASVWLWKNADPTYLASGQAVVRSSAIPELARVAWVGKGAQIFGWNAVKVLWVALFAAFALRLSVVPFHGALLDAHAEAEAPASALFTGILVGLGVYGVLRLDVGVLPEGTQWAAVAVASFGVANLVFGAFCAMAQQDLKRFVAWISIAQMGLPLLAIGAMTPQSIQASLAQTAVHGAIAALLALLAGALETRAHTRDIGRFGGLATEMPRFSFLFALALLASLGLPGLAGFWGPLLALLGAFPRHRALTVAAGAGMVVLAAGHLWALGHVIFGKVREEWRASKYLEPFGGKFPEMHGRELAAALPVAIALIILGLFPRPLLGLVDKASLELHRLVDRPGPSQIAASPEPAAPNREQA